MFEQEKSAPWYKSTIVIIIAAILLPPIGLGLIWLNSGPVRRKLIASLAVVLIAIGYVWGFGYLARMRGNEAQYALVEAHRQEQAAHAPAAAAAVTASPVAQPSASASPVAGGATEPAGASRNAWTNFRGSRRDGKYDQAVSTSWPSGGLPVLWKQPVGIGYASFAIADGKAFTIEQRRRQEVVAAYDVTTGRELWKQ